MALDIGTGFVKALICRVYDGEAEVIGVGRQRQRLTDMQGGAVTDIAGVVENVTVPSRWPSGWRVDAGKMDTVVGIAGELVKGTATTIRYKRSTPQTPIDLAELRKILDRVQYRAFERAANS